MKIVDENIVYNFDNDQYQLFGVHHKVQVYKHVNNPLRTIFDRSAHLVEVTFELDEFESIALLDQMLPIYTRDKFGYIDSFVWYSFSDDEEYDFKAFLEMDRDDPFIAVKDRYSGELHDNIITFLKSKVRSGELVEATLNQAFQLIQSNLGYQIEDNRRNNE